MFRFLQVTGSAGWGAAINGVMQAVISPLTGLSPVVAAFHPATIVMGACAGLAMLGFYCLSKRIETLQPRQHELPVLLVSKIVNIHICF